MNTPTQLLVVIPYCQKNLPQTQKLLEWISQLSPKLAPHCCLLAADSQVPHATKLDMASIIKPVFYHTETAIINVPNDANSWPRATNAMFRIVSLHIQECFKLPWLWLEPDCIPLKPFWLDMIANEYTRSPKRIMGAIIESDSKPPLPPRHLAGCAVYPRETGTMLAPFVAPEVQQAFDIANASYVLPRTHATNLIHHHWGEPGLPPIFKEERGPSDPINTCTRSFIRESAVLFHRSKDGTLIDLLRKERNNAAVNSAQGALTEQTGVQPAALEKKAKAPRSRKGEA